MKRPALFFDRDNTLLVSDGYLSDPNAVTLVAGAADAVARARRMGFATVIFSNQSGVGRGMFDEAAVEAVDARLAALLRETNSDAVVDLHEFCPFHPDAAVERYRQDSELRKPKPGMIFKAADALDLDLDQSWVIGDAPRDIAAGQAAGCRTILFTDPTLPPSSAADEELVREPDARVGTLKGAIDFIEASIRDDSEAPPEGPPMQNSPLNDNLPAVQNPGDYQAPASTDSITPPPDESPETIIVDEPPLSRLPPSAAEIPAASSQQVELASQPAPTEAPLDLDALASAFAREAAKLIKQNAPSAGPAVPGASSNVKVEHLLEELLAEFKRSRTAHPPDFSVSKLLAGIMQIMAVAALVATYFLHPPLTSDTALMLAIALQTLTIALLIMGKQ